MPPVSDVEVSSMSNTKTRERGGGSLSVDDCRCPVCLEIFMEPVTLPCSHTFCKVCFLESVDKATLCCPMCRKRVSTWARQHSRNNTLVNQNLWKQIQTCFPLQCQRRLSGQEAEDDSGVPVCCPRLSKPGELRQEYEDQITKLTEEKQALDEEQRKASEEYIQRLLAEEEEVLQEEKRRKEEDEKVARLLSNELNSTPVSQENLHPVKKKKEVGAGQIEKFLCPLPSKTSSTNSNKENFIVTQVEHSLPKLDYYGPEPPLLHPGDQSLRNRLIADGQPSSSKRKSSDWTVEEEVLNKQGCPSLPSSSLELEGWGVVQLEAELLSQRQQEEEDWHLALLLQKELDQEERQKCADRRKGSVDAYLLRGRTGEASTPSRAPKKTTKKSTTSFTFSSPSSATSLKSSSSSPSSSKQTTLTELFHPPQQLKPGTANRLHLLAQSE
ncbi:E3 ubiquitin-protein ligase rnf168 [Channa argus]|uniref:RING-type E3 ubiquitin transferase n=1 Tax=Channa argus TaxID=215402 RepID=A0A6G1PTZ6_CHAAH|nr:E3 ubiquitin-protein ligase rnf168 [Channa argus]KAK2913185.1 hypothetical protein Q8A73_007298 [Channa argus]